MCSDGEGHPPQMRLEVEIAGRLRGRGTGVWNKTPTNITIQRDGQRTKQRRMRKRATKTTTLFVDHRQASCRPAGRQQKENYT